MRKSFMRVNFKPLLHKKGKQWIVVGLSTLAFLGLGISTKNASATSIINRNLHNNINNKIQNSQNQTVPVTMHKVNTKNIQQQANNLHQRIINDQSKYQNAQSNTKLATTPVTYNTLDSANASIINKYNSVSNGRVIAEKTSTDTNSLDSDYKRNTSNTINRNPNHNTLISKDIINNNRNSNNENSNISDKAPSNQIKVNKINQNLSDKNNNKNKTKEISDVNQVDVNNSDKNKPEMKTEKIKMEKVSDTENSGNYRGMTYVYNPRDNSVEFTSGTLSQLKSNWFNSANKLISSESSRTPQKIKDATTIKIDSDVDTTHITNAYELLAENSKVQHIILPKGFIPNAVNNVRIFANDSSLSDITIPSDFANNTEKLSAMFFSDTSLRSVTFPDNFETHPLQFAGPLFDSDNQLHYLKIPYHFLNNSALKRTFLDTLGTPSLYKQNIDGNKRSLSDLSTISSEITQNNSPELSNLEGVWTTNTKPTPEYTGKHDGLYYIDHGNGNIEFVKGTMKNNDSNPFYISASTGKTDNYIKNAKSLTFDSDINYKISDAESLFSHMPRLQSLTLPSSFSYKIKYALNMISNDSILVKINIKKNSFNNLQNSTAMISRNPNLRQINIGENSFNNITNATTMFWSDSNLQSLTLPKGFGFKLNTTNGMFDGCISLQSLTIPNGFGNKILNNNVGINTFAFNMDHGSPYASNLQYLSIPSNLNPHLVTDLKYLPQMYLTNSDQTGYQYNSHNQPITNRNQNSNNFKGGIYVNHLSGTYDGLNYVYHPGSNNSTNGSSLEFTGGTLDWTGNNDSNFIEEAPNYIKHAHTIKFDNNININISQTHNFSNMLADDNDVSNIDLGNNFTDTTPSDLTNMFGGDTQLNTIKGLSDINTSNVKSMANLFADDHQLTNLSSIAYWNTNNVTDMAGIFQNDYKLSNLDVSNWNTENVTSMLDMFSGDTSLSNLNVSNFNTMNVINMGAMFYNMPKLRSLDISNFDTSNVLYMNSMFAKNNLTNLNFSKTFDTSKVINMNSMFFNMPNITTIDLRQANFNTANVSDMAGMFGADYKLNTLYINSDFDTTKAYNNSSKYSGEQYMFESDNGLKNLNISPSNHNFKLNTSSLRNNTNQVNTTLTSMQNPLGKTIAQAIINKTPIVGDNNTNAKGFDIVKYYTDDANKAGSVVNEQIFHGSQGQPDYMAMDMNSDNPYGLNTSKYFITPEGESQLNNIDNSNPAFNGTTFMVKVGQLQILPDTIEYVNNGAVVGSYTTNGAKSTSDSDITSAFNQIAQGNVQGKLDKNTYGFSPATKQEASQFAKRHYIYNNNIIKLPVSLLQTDTITYQNKDNPAQAWSKSFKGVPNTKDSDMHEILEHNLSDSDLHYDGNDYSLTNSDINANNMALDNLYTYNNAHITIPVHQRQADIIQFKNAKTNSDIDSYSFSGLQGTTDTAINSTLNKLYNNGKASILYSQDGTRTEYYIKASDAKKLESIKSDKFNYNNGNIVISVSPLGYDRIQYRTNTGNTFSTGSDYSNIPGTKDTQISADLNSFSNNETINNDYYINSNSMSVINKDKNNNYNTNNTTITIPVGTKTTDTINYQLNGETVDSISSNGIPNQSDNEIKGYLSDIKNNADSQVAPGLNTYSDNYYLTSDSRSAASAALHNKQTFPSNTIGNYVINIPVARVQKGTDTIKFYYKGKLMSSIPSYGNTNTSDTNFESNTASSSDLMTLSNLNSNLPNGKKFYISSDEYNNFKSYVTSHPFKFTNQTYTVNISQYPKDFDTIEYVTNDGKVVKSESWSDLDSYNDQNPINAVSKAQNRLDTFDPIGNGKYQLSVEGQYELARLLRDGDSNLQFNGNVIKINVAPKHIASFTVVYTINGVPRNKMVSTGLRGYRINNTNYLSNANYQTLDNGDRVYLNSDFILPSFQKSNVNYDNNTDGSNKSSFSKNLMVDPSWHGADNIHYTYNNQVITIPLISKQKKDQFDYVDNKGNIIYIADATGRNKSYIQGTTTNPNGVKMPTGIPNLGDDSTYIPNVLKHYQYTSNYNGIPYPIRFDGEENTIPVVPIPDNTPRKYNVYYIKPGDKISNAIPASQNMISDLYTSMLDYKINNKVNLAKNSDNANSILDTLDNLGNMPTNYNINASDVINSATVMSNTNHNIYLNITPATVHDLVQFKGDTKANYRLNEVVNGIDHPGTLNEPVQVQSPNGFSFATNQSDSSIHIIGNNEAEFTPNNGIHTIDLTQNQLVTETVKFRNKNTNRILPSSYFASGYANSNSTINKGDIPSGYHLASNQSDYYTFATSNSTDYVNVIPDYNYNSDISLLNSSVNSASVNSAYANSISSVASGYASSANSDANSSVITSQYTSNSTADSLVNSLSNAVIDDRNIANNDHSKMSGYIQEIQSDENNSDSLKANTDMNNATPILNNLSSANTAINNNINSANNISSQMSNVEPQTVSEDKIIFAIKVNHKNQSDYQQVGSSFFMKGGKGDIGTISDSDVPQGYKLVNSDINQRQFRYGQYEFGQNAHIFIVQKSSSTPTNSQITANVKYYDQNNQPINTNKNTISGTVNNSIILNLPHGYHLMSDTNYHFGSNKKLYDINNQVVNKDSSDNSYHIQLDGDNIMGTATIYKHYQQSDGKSDIQPAEISLHSQVGDSTTIYPSDYNMIGYSNHNQPWTIHFTPSDINPVDNYGTNFTPTHTFTYHGKDIDIKVQYENSSDSNKIIGTDDLNTYVLEGSTIDLQVQNAFDNTAEVVINGTKHTLNIPQGYHLENNNNYITVVQSKDKQGNGVVNADNKPVSLLTLNLSQANNNSDEPNNNTPIQPNIPNTPNITPVIPNTPSNASSSNNSPISSTNNSVSNNRSNSNQASSVTSSTSNSVTPITPNNTPNQNHADHFEPLARHHIRHIHNILQIKPTQKVYYKHLIIQNMTNKYTPHYIYNIKAVLLHKNINRIGYHDTTAIKINKKRGFTGKVIRKFKINNKIRYMISWNHHNYFTTARKDYVKNAYIQSKEFHKYAHGIIKHMTVKLRKDIKAYNSIHFTSKHFKYNIKADKKLNVTNVKNFGRKGEKRTRLILANGLVITANKNFVKII